MIGSFVVEVHRHGASNDDTQKKAVREQSMATDYIGV
jgi:hypothetical protein